MAGVLSAVVWLFVPASLSTQFFRAFGVMLAGAFPLLIAVRPTRPQRQALLAVLVTGAAATIWLVVLGLRLGDIETDLARRMSAFLRTQAQVSAAMGGSFAADARTFFEQLASQSRDFAELLPATLALFSFCGLALAWRGFHYLSSHPWGAEPRPFARFTFNDHAIWLLVLSLGLSFAPVGEALGGVSIAAANLLTIMLVLYAVRGAAIFRSSLVSVSGLAMFLFVVVTILMFGFVVAGLIVLGIADTWLDFRRRAAAPSTGGK